MPDYKKMYAVLCGAIDKALETLDKIPMAAQISKSLQVALLEAEEIYIETTPYLEEAADSKILEFKIDIQK